MAIRGIVAVQRYIYPLFIFIWVELYLTLYLNYPYRSGLVHWDDHKFYQPKYKSYTHGMSSSHPQMTPPSFVFLEYLWNYV